ncbi:dephospho-CoA kinase [Sulfuriferula sp. AH1]|uniref:dephospho-CoA kinase n=1 Tax=Sulfuriferula sp. AH1 TaxID=1985873 RepID=UPI000B3B5BD2|nr:dephospho-CoA kinase [Sulfuriferula sp. AH1]ARU30534.1 dephospho-CoA kinase [Sulfuriferula sp. AH1]
MSFIVGLTGGIGCGKTTVSRIFAELGAVIIDTDEIAHSLTQPDGLAMPEIARTFGENYVAQNGVLDRPRMRKLVFNDTDAKHQLEAILHPLIYQAVTAAVASHPDATYILLVVPLLIETRRYLDMVQRILVVDCDEQQQISRAIARSGLSEDAVQRIMQNQTTRQQRLQFADDVILNRNSLEFTRQQVTELHRLYLAQAQSFHATH